MSETFVRKCELQSMLESIIPKITENVKKKLAEPEKQPAECSSKSHSDTIEKKDHAVAVHGKIGENSISGFNDNQWKKV